MKEENQMLMSNEVKAKCILLERTSTEAEIKFETAEDNMKRCSRDEEREEHTNN